MSTEISEAVAAMIAERQASRRAEYVAERTVKDGFRKEVTRRRKFGLVQRHAAKLARNAQQGQVA